MTWESRIFNEHTWWNSGLRSAGSACVLLDVAVLELTSSDMAVDVVPSPPPDIVYCSPVHRMVMLDCNLDHFYDYVEELRELVDRLAAGITELETTIGELTEKGSGSGYEEALTKAKAHLAALESRQDKLAAVHKKSDDLYGSVSTRIWDLAGQLEEIGYGVKPSAEFILNHLEQYKIARGTGTSDPGDLIDGWSDALAAVCKANATVNEDCHTYQVWMEEQHEEFDSGVEIGP